MFEQLIMCQSELSFSLDVIKSAHKGKLRKEMAILFEEDKDSASDSDEPPVDVKISPETDNVNEIQLPSVVKQELITSPVV